MNEQSQKTSNGFQWVVCSVLIKIVFIIAVFFACFVCLVHYLYFVSVNKQRSSLEFTKENWAEVNIRYKMYDDLIKHHIKEKMYISDVKALLGNPDYKRKYNTFFNKNMCLEYRLGVVGHDFIHAPNSLIICPDNSGQKLGSLKLIGASIIPDFGKRLKV